MVAAGSPKAQLHLERLGGGGGGGVKEEQEVGGVKETRSHYALQLGIVGRL